MLAARIESGAYGTAEWCNPSFGQRRAISLMLSQCGRRVAAGIAAGAFCGVQDGTSKRRPFDFIRRRDFEAPA
jgi:hypothetical protein